MKLEEIVPEYHSRNFLLKNLFLERLNKALKLVEPELRLKNNLNMIDLGCGDGTMLKMFEEKFKNVKTFGIDTEPNIIKLENILRAEIKVSDIRSVEFADKFFDIAFCLDVLEHFENLEDPIKEIKRIIKHGGLLIISSPTENLFYKLGRFLIKGTTSPKVGPYCGFNFSPHFHNAEEIEKVLSANEFKIIKKIKLPRFLTLFNIIAFRHNN